MRLRVTWCTFALVGMVACTQAAEFRDQFRVSDCQMPFNKRLRSELAAPIIVLGQVLEVTEVGKPKPSTADRRIKIQLTRIRIDIKEAIKGRVKSNPLEFYYFAYSPAASEIDLGAPRYIPTVGQQRIYFLRPSEDFYRSVADVTDYTLRVSSGSHKRGFCTGKGPGCCIAEMLLLPQQDVDAKRFVADLIQSEFASEVLCSRSATEQLMRDLVQNPDGQISDAARAVIGGTRLSK